MKHNVYIHNLSTRGQHRINYPLTAVCILQTFHTTDILQYSDDGPKVFFEFLVSVIF